MKPITKNHYFVNDDLTVQAHSDGFVVLVEVDGVDFYVNPKDLEFFQTAINQAIVDAIAWRDSDDDSEEVEAIGNSPDVMQKLTDIANSLAAIEKRLTGSK